MMAMWIGAVMEKTPHAPLNDMTHALGTDAFLLVNRHGERFCNEELDTEAMARQAEEQNGCWLVVDATWPDDLPHMGLGFARYFEDIPEVRKRFQENVDEGIILEADSIKALAEKGSKRAALVDDVLHKPEKFFSITLLGTNMAVVLSNATAAFMVIN